jgi:hypothetical protein
VFFAREPFFLSGSDKFAVYQQTGGRIVIKGRKAKYVHKASFPIGESLPIKTGNR